MTSVSLTATPCFARDDVVRGFLIALVALALSSAPAFVAVGAPHHGSGEVQTGMAGVVPFLVDPGHRVSPSPAGSGHVPTVAGIAVQRTWAGAEALAAARGPLAQSTDLVWLQRMLTPVRLLTDGG